MAETTIEIVLKDRTLKLTPSEAKKVHHQLSKIFALGEFRDQMPVYIPSLPFPRWEDIYPDWDKYKITYRTTTGNVDIT